MVVLLITDASLTLSLVFAYLFLWTTRPVVWPPDGSLVPDLATPAVLAGLVVISYICFEVAERLNRRDGRFMVSACLLQRPFFLPSR
jgi:cytochrome c oxidase subunit I+III